MLWCSVENCVVVKIVLKMAVFVWRQPGPSWFILLFNNEWDLDWDWLSTDPLVLGDYWIHECGCTVWPFEWINLYRWWIGCVQWQCPVLIPGGSTLNKSWVPWQLGPNFSSNESLWFCPMLNTWWDLCEFPNTSVGETTGKRKPSQWRFDPNIQTRSFQDRPTHFQTGCFGFLHFIPMHRYSMVLQCRAILRVCPAIVVCYFPKTTNNKNIRDSLCWQMCYICSGVALNGFAWSWRSCVQQTRTWTKAKFAKVGVVHWYSVERMGGRKPTFWTRLNVWDGIPCFVHIARVKDGISCFVRVRTDGRTAWREKKT